MLTDSRAVEHTENEPAADDARFLFLWIAFNAPYARGIPERDRFSERRVRMNFLRELTDADEEVAHYESEMLAYNREDDHRGELCLFH